MGSYIVFIVLLLFVACMGILYRFLKSSNNKCDVNFPYYSKYILTNSEYRFYETLKPLMDEYSYIICPKVGLKELFEVNAGIKERMKYFSKISQKHVDFLVCDSSLQPLFAIELDDKSHKRKYVQEKDAFKDNLFSHTGFPLFRVPTTSTYSKDYIMGYLNLSKSEKSVEELVN